MVDLAQHRVLNKLKVGSDPEQLALSRDGTHLFVSNEDIGTATVLNVLSGKVEHIIPVSREPEGIGTSPDGTVVAAGGEDGTVRVYNGANGQLTKTLLPPDAQPKAPEKK